MKVYHNKRQRIKTSALNTVLLEAVNVYPPPAVKGKHIKIKYVTQLPSKSPAFALFANLPQYIKEPYRRYIENKIRENFDFTGVPLQIYFRQK
jgi:GTP-binding protein